MRDRIVCVFFFHFSSEWEWNGNSKSSDEKHSNIDFTIRFIYYISFQERLIDLMLQNRMENKKNENFGRNWTELTPFFIYMIDYNSLFLSFQLPNQTFISVHVPRYHPQFHIPCTCSMFAKRIRFVYFIYTYFVKVDPNRIQTQIHRHLHGSL